MILHDGSGSAKIDLNWRKTPKLRAGAAKLDRADGTVYVNGMVSASRRQLLLGLFAGTAAGFVATPAAATVMRAISLPELVRSSRHVLVLTPLDAESHFEDLGRKRRIVTDTRVRVEEALAKAEGVESELLIRTLGGAVGRLGERVDGQAQLVLGEPGLAFLLRAPDGLHYVNAMAQGHYPLRGAARRLASNARAEEILGYEVSAVKDLVGADLSAARERIRALESR